MKLLAFVKKDALVTLSYRFQLLLNVGSLIVSLVVFYFIGRTFAGALSPHLRPYGDDYFPYVLVGISVSSFVSVGLRALSRQLRVAQVEGTLEALLVTPTALSTVLIGNSLWSFITALSGSIFILAGGFFFAGMTLSWVQAGLSLVVLLLTFVAFLSVGMLSASFVMVFKRGDPVAVVFGTASYLFGGVVFPVDVLPPFFVRLGGLLPITHAIRALRELLLAHTPASEVVGGLGNLCLFIVVTAPIAALLFGCAVTHAKREGTLVQY